jgi:hypothetical protein
LYGAFENKEKKRIKRENSRLAKKIIDASPSFTVKQLKQQYKVVEKIKRNICKPHILTSKFTNLPIIQGKSLQSKKMSETVSPLYFY